MARVRRGADLAHPRAARDAAANDPVFTAAVADHAKSVAARDQLAAQHREPNKAFAALQREYSPAAERARTLRAQAERARVELERHQQVREAGLVGGYELASPTGLREVHVTEHGTNVWARRADDRWSRIVDVERHFDYGGSVVRFHYDDGTAENSHTHYGQGRTTSNGPTELAVAAPTPGAAVLTGSFVGESDSTG